MTEELALDFPKEDCAVLSSPKTVVILVWFAVGCRRGGTQHLEVSAYKLGHPKRCSSDGK